MQFSLLLVPDPEHIFDRTRLPRLQILQPLFHPSLQPPRHHLIRMPPEIPFLQPPSKIPEQQVRKLLIPRFGCPTRLLLPCIAIRAPVRDADVRDRVFDMAGNGRVIPPWEDERDVRAPVCGEGGADVLVGIVFADGVEGVVDPSLMLLCYVFQLGHELGVADPVVENDVAFGLVDEGFYVRDPAAGDADQRVDVGLKGELDGVGAYCAGGAVDD